MFRYLFPDEDLYNKAIIAQKKYSKGFSISIIVSVILAVIVSIVLCSDLILKLHIKGYTFPIFLAIIFIGILIGALFCSKDLKKVEKQQKQRFKDQPKYSLNLKLFELYDNYARKQALLTLPLLLITFLSSMVLAILFPNQYWSVCCCIILFPTLFAITKLNNKLRQQEASLKQAIEKEMTNTSIDNITNPTDTDENK